MAASTLKFTNVPGLIVIPQLDDYVVLSPDDLDEDWPKRTDDTGGQSGSDDDGPIVESWSGRVAERFDESQHPRDHGRFAEKGGGTEFHGDDHGWPSGRQPSREAPERSESKSSDSDQGKEPVKSEGPSKAVNKALKDMDNEELVAAHHAGDKQAMTALVEKNQGLVAKWARKKTKDPDRLADLMQEGMIGLMKAAHDYDPSKGAKFSTYATLHIRGAQGHYMDKKSNRERGTGGPDPDDDFRESDPVDSSDPGPGQLSQQHEALLYFNGGPDALFPQGRTRNVAEWIPVLAIQHGSVTYFYRKTDVHLPTGGKFLTYVYAGSRRHPAIDAEDD